MYHFFVKQEQIDSGAAMVTIAGPDVNHIRNVLRMKPGEEILVGNGTDTDYLCRIEQIASEHVTARILSRAENTELPAKIYLFQGLPKSDKMELIIQKAVELGVYQVIPVNTSRTVVKLDAKKEESRVRRWNAIAESAAKQSGRVLVPEVTPVMDLGRALAYAADLDVKMIPYENARGMEVTAQAVGAVRPGTSVGVLIGPEGGFERAEVDEAFNAGFTPISLGRRILRTETAGLAVLSILMYQLETYSDLNATGSFAAEEALI